MAAVSTGVVGEVADAVAAVIAAQALVTLGGRITTGEARLLARRSTEAVRTDGWYITALPHPHTDHHHDEEPVPENPALRSYDRVLLAGLARGETAARIGSSTQVPIQTIRNRTLRLRRRIGARSCAHAVALAYRHGWLAGLTPEPRPGGTELSGRQAQVLRAAADGMTNPQIAKALGLSVTSVGIYLRRAYLQLGATNRPHAVALAYQHGHLAASDRSGAAK